MMLKSNIPIKFPIPWANGAVAPFVRPIPVPSQVGSELGAASLTDGLPPACFSPIAAGGSWPFGADWNGILQQITQWSRWHQAGGPVVYDAAFQTAIGGYPQGAVLGSATTLDRLWLCTVDANTTNPDTGGAGWSMLGTGRFLNRQYLTAPSGIYTPSVGASEVFVRLYGDGGASGGCPATPAGLSSLGQPGSGGGYGEKRITGGFSGINYTVGQGGVPVLGGTGGSGSGCWFGAFVMVNGGRGGNIYGPTGGFFAPGEPGAPVGAGGEVNAAGNPGQWGQTFNGGGTIPGMPGGSGFYPGQGSGGHGTTNGSAAAQPAQIGISGQPGLITVDEYS